MSDTMIHMYGIANCDTIRKARSWLGERNIPYSFHDYKKEGVDLSVLQAACDVHGWELVLNRRGTTWRKLPDCDKLEIDADKAIALMLAHPSMIKRPLLVVGKQIYLGFSEDQYRQLPT